MNTPEANKILERIIKDVEKNGLEVEILIPELQKVREFALKENDPLVTRAIRLTWQHLETNEGFQIAYLEEAETQEENFLYLLQLCLKTDNTYNRDELREITNLMQAAA
jgi:hypothetical protein